MLLAAVFLLVLLSALSRGLEVVDHEHVEKFYQYGYQVEDTYTGHTSYSELCPLLV